MSYELFDLSGKVAIVTGGNSGIGFGIAKGLCLAGATVVVAARNEEKLLEAVQQLEASNGKTFAVSCDVTNETSIQRMVQVVAEKTGRIDILVNNAGTTVRKQPEALSFEEWRSVIATNLDSAFLCSTACFPYLKQNGGKILNNDSMLALFVSSWSSAYAASKGGIVQLTKSLATAWAEHNIQVNCFLPGWIDTPLTVGARQQVEGLYEKVVARTPAKRWGTLDDFQRIAIFLSSSASDFITGAVIPVDGGFSVSVM
jgi:2-dehydro-3-deoxy-D-gluconate 5-dehydrogenase